MAASTPSLPQPEVGARIPVETLAVIDLGTNTFHLLLVEIFDNEEHLVREKFKEYVKLGEGGITSGIIAPGPFQRGIQALTKFRQVLDSRGIRKVLACATSAIRSASNGKDFVAEAKAKAGIDIRIINGNEEALLIYKGVRRGVQFPFDEDVLLVDIGGGSVEFVVARGNQPKLLRSLRLGAARMIETINPSDPITEAQMQATRELIRSQADSLMDEIAEFGIHRMIGSSGTFETLATLAAFENQDMLAVNNPNGYRFDRKRFKRLLRRILTATRAQRMQMGGIDQARVDMIVPGSILVDYVLDRLNIDQIMVSNYALKEGILADYIETSRDRTHDAQERNLREQAVRLLAVRYDVDLAHAEHVAKLSLQLFDGLKEIHGYGQEERELLYYGALLHDVGHFVNRSGHHKHGQYIVMNSEMKGFSTNELLIISNLVRYHRKSLPTREHFHYNMLYKEHKDVVRRLAGIIRIADNLDRGHRAAVRGVRPMVVPGPIFPTVHIHVSAKEDIELELDHARMNLELFEDGFGMGAELVRA